MKRSGIVVTALILALGVCSAFAAPEKASPAPAAKKPSVKSEQDSSGFLSGKVVETMNAGGYTYVCLEKGGKKSWVAVPETKMTVGSQMSFMPGQVMTDFTSKSWTRPSSPSCSPEDRWPPPASRPSASPAIPR